MENQEKQFVSLYLPVNLANKVEALKEENIKDEEILRLFDKSKSDIKSLVESLDEDVIKYKGLMVYARNSFREAAQAELEANYSLWETFDKDIAETKKKVDSMKNELLPLKRELEEVNKLIGNIQGWQLKDFLKTLSEINEILSYDNEKNRMIKFLMEKFTFNKE